MTPTLFIISFLVLVYVIFKESLSISTTTTTSELTLPIRLVSNSSSIGAQYVGRLEILHNGQWGTVCNKSWTFQDSLIVCKELGYTSTEQFYTAGLTNPGTGPIWLSNVNCTGLEVSLSSCKGYKYIGVVTGCSHINDVGVVCSDNFAIRLVSDSSYDSEGRVEVYHSDQWGTICDDDWSLADAIVVCKQLGYPKVLDYYKFAHFGNGTGQIWIDNIQCVGNESSIGQCQFRGWGIHNCSHQEDVGVRCAPVNYSIPVYPVRLVTDTGNSTHNSSLYYGQVQIRNGTISQLNATWGTVCNDGWGIEDANIVCRQLGFKGAVLALSHSPFITSSSTLPILLDEVTCLGNEEGLSQCHYRNWGLHDCSHYQDASVICQVPGISIDTVTNVRLIMPGNLPNTSNDNTTAQGRIEIEFMGIWGTICDNMWDINDANIICRMLGYANAIDIVTHSIYGVGQGPIWMDNVECIGNEITIEQCTFPGWGINNCEHNKDVGVVCIAAQQGDPVQLIGGTSSMEGHIEILHNGEWGTVCDNYWTNDDATVVCKQLGFKGSQGIAIQGGQFSSGSSDMIIWMDDVNCTGYEDYLSDCPFNGWSYHNCSHNNDAGVKCQGSAYHYPVRLYNNGRVSDNEGTVEVFISSTNTWGLICDYLWDLHDANVVCRMLGYNGAAIATLGSYYGTETLSFVANYISCQGFESELSDCPGFITYQQYVQDCSSTNAAGVKCLSLRLVNGSNQFEGTVQVFHNGTWYLVCGNNWDILDASVVCHQLGYVDAIAATRYSHFGISSGPIWLNDVECFGNESTLFDCPNGGNHHCTHNNNAGVICTNQHDHLADIRLRLVNGNVPNEGRVEIFYNNTWGTICDNYWGENDAKVVCRQLGYDPSQGVKAYSSAYFGPGTGPVYLDKVRCVGNEESITECTFLGFGNFNCLHRHNAAVHCNSKWKCSESSCNSSIMSSLLITTISSAITTSLTSLWPTTHHSSSLISISTSTIPWYSESLIISTTSLVVSSQSSPYFFTSNTFTSISTSEFVLSRTLSSSEFLSISHFVSSQSSPDTFTSNTFPSINASEFILSRTLSSSSEFLSISHFVSSQSTTISSVISPSVLSTFYFPTSDSLAILSSTVATVYSFSSSSITTKYRTLSITASKYEVHSSIIPSPSSVSISLTVNTNSPFESAGSSTSKDTSVLTSPTAHVPRLSSSQEAAIIGSVLGVFILLLIIVIVVMAVIIRVLWKRRRRRRYNFLIPDDDDDNEKEEDIHYDKHLQLSCHDNRQVGEHYFQSEDHEQRGQPCLLLFEEDDTNLVI